MNLFFEHIFQTAETEWVFLLMLLLAGILSSCINMLSGGGSLIVISLMMLMGVEPAVANATNRVGVLVSTSSGALAYKSEKITEFSESFKLGIWAIPGAIAGAYFSVKISSELFEILLAFVMIFILITLFIPQKTENINNPANWEKKLLYPSMLIVGFYGGFIQVGVGFLIFGSLRYFGKMDLMRMNMHRVFIVLLCMLPVFTIFLWNGKINWTYASALCIGNAMGSWITVKLAIKKGERIIKYGMATTIVLIAGKFLFA